MHVIGTAGHIDHGKSTLIQALTGIDPDRLREEKERGMTIDLGFAWIQLPSGLEAGMVDVPGHHRFVRNMLAGVGGIDLVLLVVAATESWMPQSQEHLDIIDLLGIRRGVVALTKADLVESDWLDMVAEEVREKLVGTSLAGADVIPVSSTTGQGLKTLQAKIDALLMETPLPEDRNQPRLWIDRVFTIRGSGTVVTGTLEQGTLQVDQPVQVLPAGALSRVRGMQTHRKPVERAVPGSRVAVNLAGMETESLQRGDALVLPGQRAASDTLNVQLRLLAGLGYALPEKCELKLYVGTAELLAQVQLLDRETLNPGETGLAQLRLERAAAIDFHDRFIVRDGTRQETVGGGLVLDAHAYRVRGRDLRLPRSAPGSYRVLSTAKVPVRRLDLSQLQARVEATTELLPLLIVEERGWATLEELMVEVPMAAVSLRPILMQDAEQGKLVLLSSYAVAPGTWLDLGRHIQGELEAFHQRYPLRTGIGRETLRSSLGLDTKLFDEVIDTLAKEGLLTIAGAVVRLASFTAEFTPEHQHEVTKIIELLRSHGYSPPELADIIGPLGCDPEVVSALIEQGRLVKVNKAMVYLKEITDEAKASIADTIKAQGAIDIGAVRDSLGTSRKYAVPLMEYFDQIGFTRRVGDKRVLA